MFDSLQVNLGLKNWYECESTIEKETLKILDELGLRTHSNIIEHYFATIERRNEEQFAVEISHQKMAYLYTRGGAHVIRRSNILIVGGNGITCKNEYKNVIQNEALPSLMKGHETALSQDKSDFCKPHVTKVEALISIINDGLGLGLSFSEYDSKRLYLTKSNSDIRLALNLPNHLEIYFSKNNQSFIYTLQKEIESIYKEADSISMFVKSKIELNS